MRGGCRNFKAKCFKVLPNLFDFTSRDQFRYGDRLFGSVSVRFAIQGHQIYVASCSLHAPTLQDKLLWEFLVLVFWTATVASRISQFCLYLGWNFVWIASYLFLQLNLSSSGNYRKVFFSKSKQHSYSELGPTPNRFWHINSALNKAITFPTSSTKNSILFFFQKRSIFLHTALVSTLAECLGHWDPLYFLNRDRINVVSYIPHPQYFYCWPPSRKFVSTFFKIFGVAWQGY